MKREGCLIREIRKAVREGRLHEPFRAKDVIAAGVFCAPSTPSTFLAKHCAGNPGEDSELFIRVGRGEYRLIEHRP